jgi:hypothetical protein
VDGSRQTEEVPGGSSDWRRSAWPPTSPRKMACAWTLGGTRGEGGKIVLWARMMAWARAPHRPEGREGGQRKEAGPGGMAERRRRRQ